MITALAISFWISPQFDYGSENSKPLPPKLEMIIEQVAPFSRTQPRLRILLTNKSTTPIKIDPAIAPGGRMTVLFSDAKGQRIRYRYDDWGSTPPKFAPDRAIYLAQGTVYGYDRGYVLRSPPAKVYVRAIYAYDRRKAAGVWSGRVQSNVIRIRG